VLTSKRAEDKNNTRYFLEANPDEAERLQLGQLIIIDHMGKLVWAPLDIAKPGLRILESATASGTLVLSPHLCRVMLIQNRCMALRPQSQPARGVQ
jgi:hypothetical protein